MPFKIAIASGKGGTGKTTVSVNLYHYLNNVFDHEVQLIDCDVEEPNDLLFFPEAITTRQETVNRQVPQIDLTKCTYCKRCSGYCEFNAISIIPSVKYAEITVSLCHSCGACSVACPSGAITETAHAIGTITHYRLPKSKDLIEGRLNIGSSLQTMVLKETKKKADTSAKIILFDSPPGTSCPVVETIADTNYVIIVTEPTPFGLHDMKLMVELLRELEKPFGIIINKSGLGNDEVFNYIGQEQLELLGEIPFLKSYAANYAAGQLMQNIPAEIETTYQHIVNRIKLKIKQQ